MLRFFKQVWPRTNLADKAAFSFTHIGLVGIALFEIFIVLPRYHAPFTPMYCMQLFIGLYLEFQVFSNLYALVRTDTTVKTHMNLPCVLLPGWTYCHVCQMNAPPRSYHCPVCDVCVLKRDHHCNFSGNCVGFRNHRYFMMMVAHLWIGSFYALNYNMHFYLKTVGPIDLTLFIKLFFPMLVWTFGYMSLYQLFIAVVMGVHLMAMFLFTALASFQTSFITSGQTQFECRKKIKDYAKGVVENWLLVLGKKWYLVWLSSAIVSELPGDGTDFEKTAVQMSPIEGSVKVI